MLDRCGRSLDSMDPVEEPWQARLIEQASYRITTLNQGVETHSGGLFSGPIIRLPAR